MIMKADTPTCRTLFDFQAATLSPTWDVVNDEVMGGVSTSQFQMQTSGGAVFSGTVRLENSGGFASVRSAHVHQDLTGFTAFVLRVRGDGRRYKFSVRTEVGLLTPLYQSSFTTRQGGWEEHRLAFCDFVPTFRGRAAGRPTKVRRIAGMNLKTAMDTGKFARCAKKKALGDEGWRTSQRPSIGSRRDFPFSP